MKSIQGGVFTTVDNTNDIVRVMEVKEAVRRIREHNKIHQSAEPRNSPIITEILESCARLLEDIDAGKVRYVKHGHWERIGYLDMCCLECGNTPDHEQGMTPEASDFCPNCGAEMDGGEHETD